jgi:hypothetical protein
VRTKEGEGGSGSAIPWFIGEILSLPKFLGYYVFHLYCTVGWVDIGTRTRVGRESVGFHEKI